ncbi:hypothetical protein D3C87_2031150 [compost metagenome]
MYIFSCSTMDFISGSESASISGAMVILRARARPSSALRKPLGAPGRMKGRPSSLSKVTSPELVRASPAAPTR